MGMGGGGRDPFIAARRPERPMLEMCLSASVTALGMIMAGTGDLECLRLMRELRGRVEGEVGAMQLEYCCGTEGCVEGREWSAPGGVYSRTVIMFLSDSKAYLTLNDLSHRSPLLHRPAPHPPASPPSLLPLPPSPGLVAGDLRHTHGDSDGDWAAVPRRWHGVPGERK